MKVMHREFSELKKILGSPVRSHQQKNQLFESDCEILQLGPKNFLTTSIDSIGEEISMGLYKDIETWAWMAVMSSVSDLAASGTQALGLTLSTQWAFGTSISVQKKFYQGIGKACARAQVSLLGGDSGWAQDHVLTSSIFGTSSTAPLQRIGARAGDYLILSHQNNVGVGPALAFAYLLKEKFNEKKFRPSPSWKLSYQLRPWVRAAIDTSDGIATSLSLLATLNDLGFEIFWNEKINSTEALRFCHQNWLPTPLLWMGDHGDFQTLFVVPEKNVHHFRRPGLAILGQLTRKKDFLMNWDSRKLALPLQKIVGSKRDVSSYNKLLKVLKTYFSKEV